MENVKIVVDSSADVYDFEGVDFDAAPLKIVTSEKEYVDDKSLDVKQMVDDLKAYSGRSSTSCPNTEDWLKCFGDAQYIFCVTITSGLSGSYNSACLAKKQYEESYPDRRVYVIDSKSTGPEMLLITEKLKKLIDDGNDFEAVCQKIDAYMQKTGLLFMLQSMRNLANNGRVSHIAAKIAGVLGIRALGKASVEGKLEMLEKSRGEKHSLDAFVSILKNEGFNGGNVRISHCFNQDFAFSLKERLEKEFAACSVKILPCGGLCSFYAEEGGVLVGFEKE